MEECIFCKIANGEIGTLVYENEFVAAFDDLNPQAPVHTLIVPKKHIVNIEDLKIGEGHCNHEQKESEVPCDGKYIKEIFKAIKEVAKIKGVAESGYRIISNCGKDAGQTVMHLHFHLIAGKELGDKIV
ncbi:MAG: HIT domain-containing protein [Clostridia bacterium]|nr:HIT domain-containing protein [Clostridia bacterium]